MPKLRPITEAERRNQAFQGQLHARMKAEHMSHERLAKMMGISLMTLYRKRDEPERLTLKEIRMLQEIFPGIEIQ